MLTPFGKGVGVVCPVVVRAMCGFTVMNWLGLKLCYVPAGLGAFGRTGCAPAGHGAFGGRRVNSGFGGTCWLCCLRHSPAMFVVRLGD
jgi:hypothetical protein